MKRLLTLATLASLAPAVAFAQSSEPSFTGPHVAISGGWNQNQDKKVLTGTSKDSRSRGGIAVRGAAGYDIGIGRMAIVGGEVGIATGGRDVVTRRGTSSYRTDPRLTLDATARVGIKPVDNVLLFGKAGWAMQNVRTRLATTTGSLSSKSTEHGFLWGAGAELAVTRNVALRADFDRVSFNDHYRRNRVLAGVNVRF
ncbi:outer membrane beta-barrel protein [Sphingomonas kyeonggiensis]|uniref:Opacity protein-like surface antigen n=1 Tax=Sphingomonas kyeonggiensis TaxID=1268553 RepID=A0A7W6NVN5_9SPHN|nr:opacity protein-like surface antigen [Sphingomonas kyeonggiensis]